MPTRVLLAHLPNMLLDVIRQVLNQPDVEVVGVTEDPIQTLLVTGNTRPDVVVLGIEAADLPGLADQLLDEYLHLNVLALTPDARSAFRYSLRPELVALGTVSPDQLLAAIRATSGASPPDGLAAS